MPFALVAAMLASLGLHAAALLIPEVDLPPAPEPAPLSAEIVLRPRAAPLAGAKGDLPPPVRAGRKAAPPSRSAVPAAPITDAAADGAATTADGAADGAAVGEPPADPPAAAFAEPATPSVSSPDLPASGSISYDVYHGSEPATLVGSAEQHWEMADGRYRISSVMETRGVAAWLRAVHIETESSGRLAADGLQPERYVLRRRDRERVEQVDFDREQGVVRFGSGATAPLPAGVQDLLSFNYQLGWLARTGDLAIATGRKLGTYRLELLGKEWVDTAAQPIWALHFRASGETTTEVWLAPDKYLLPVKIRHIDKKGERFEQVAREIRLPPP